jgi:hypothetical protein
MRGTATEAAEGSEATGTIRSEAGEVVAVAVDAGVGTFDHATYVLSSATPADMALRMLLDGVRVPETPLSELRPSRTIYAASIRSQGLARIALRRVELLQTPNCGHFHPRRHAYSTRHTTKFCHRAQRPSGVTGPPLPHIITTTRRRMNSTTSTPPRTGRCLCHTTSATMQR